MKAGQRKLKVCLSHTYPENKISKYIGFLVSVQGILTPDKM